MIAGRTGAWRWVVTALIFAGLVSSLESVMIFAALKAFIGIFGDPIGVGWVVSGFLLVSAVAAAICGRLGDIYGRRRLLLIVLAAATVGSLISASADTLEWVIAGRAVQGMAGAVIPLCLGLLRENVPADRLPMSIGILMAASGIGATLGVVLGGLIVDNMDWRHIFTVSAALAAFAYAACWTLVPRSKTTAPTGGIDWLGGLLFAPAVAAILLAIGEIPASGWFAPNVITRAGIGAGLLGWWLWHELRHPSPLINVRLLMRGELAVAYLCMAVLAVGAMQLTQLQMLFLQQPVATGIGLGLSATMAGVMKLPAKLASPIASPIAGILAGRFGGRSVVIAGFSTCISGWIGVAAGHESLLLVVLAMAFGASLGLTITYVGISALVVLVAPADRASESAGLLTVVRAIAQAIGSQLIMTLLATSTVVAINGGTYPDATAYMLCFGAIIVTSCVGIALAMLLPRKQPTDAKGTSAGPDGILVQEHSNA